MEKVTVLFLAANPTGTIALRLDEEIRAIGAKMRASAYRDSLNLVSAWAVRPDDLLQALNEHRPQVVHFSGHGTPTGDIVLLDDRGAPTPVGVPALRALFRTLKDNIRLVVFNACYSHIQATALAGTIDCVVGMSTEIGDDAAVVFAASFYRAIAFGRSVADAFEQGKTALMLEGIPEDATPRMAVKAGVDPSSIYLLARPEPSQSRDPLDQALQLAASGDDHAAIRFLCAASDAEPGRALVHYNLAVLYERTGQQPEAIRHYRKAARLEDPFGAAYYNLGMLYVRSEAYDQAETELKMAVSRNPAHSEALNALGGIETRRGNYGGAVAWFGKALALDADHPMILNNLADALMRAGRLSEASAAIKQARRLDPANEIVRLTEDEIRSKTEG